MVGTYGPYTTTLITKTEVPTYVPTQEWKNYLSASSGDDDITDIVAVEISEASKVEFQTGHAD